MNLSIKKILTGSVAALVLVSITFSAQAGGFRFGGGGGSGNSGGGFRPSGGSTFRGATTFRPGNTFRSGNSFNTGRTNFAQSFRSSGVHTSGFKPMVHKPMVHQNHTFRAAPVRTNPGSWRKPVTTVRSGMNLRNSHTNHWNRSSVVVHKAGGQGMRRLSRPTWIKPLRFGKYVWNTPFHRGLHGRWIINSCVGITPYVAGGSYEDAQGLMQVDSGDASQFSGAEIKIACGPEMPGSVGYMLNGTEYDMQPGYSQKFAEDRTWVIQFRSGDENSEIVEFTLTAGEYQFVVVDGKLNLTPVSQDGLQSVSPEVQQDVAPEVQQDVAPEAAQNVVPDVTLQQFNSDGSASP